MLRAPGRKSVVVKPHLPNAGVRIWYYMQLERFLEQMHREISTLVLAEYRKARPIYPLAADNSITDALQGLFKRIASFWQGRVTSKSQEIAAFFVYKSMRANDFSMRKQFKKAGFDVKLNFTPEIEQIAKAAIAENVALIESIPAQYFKEIQTKVWQSVSRGGDLHTLAQDLHKSYGISQRRAATIARDQNNKVKAVTENARRLELGLTHARWHHSGGGKEPRASHVAFSGKIFDLKKGAYLDGKWVLPGSEINCRCTSSVVVPGFDD